jgi:hypothetical protein
MKYPFEADEAEILTQPESFVSAVFASLESEFLVLPKGSGFVEYPIFEAGYEALKKGTFSFAELNPEVVLEVCTECPISLVVLRCMLGFTPPEWAYVASLRGGTTVPQNAARSLDRDVRIKPLARINWSGLNRDRVFALVQAACEFLEKGCPDVPADRIHRLQKADTVGGLPAVRNMASIGTPYAMLLYERFLGRPFAGHRDAVSGMIGDNLEGIIEEAMMHKGISFRKTRRAERIPGFDQAPDFIIPDEFSPKVVIESKITEDDGTARDKVTRIIRLCQMAVERTRQGLVTYEVVACIAGRGFGVRREDMRQLILHTKGKVFTPKTMTRLVECTALKDFQTKNW